MKASLYRVPDMLQTETVTERRRFFQERSRLYFQSGISGI